jgi:hypothetical protein
MTRPAPLTDADADLTTFKDMPFEVVRFAKSDLVAFASAEAVLAAMMLWGSSWHSRPAGSLTNDDRALMRAAGFGRGAEAAWHAVREDALRGWIECSDGRLYHPVVAEKVAQSWKAKLKQKHANYLTAIRMHNARNPEDQRGKVTFDDWHAMGRPDEVKGSAPKPVQEELDLPNDEMLRGIPDPVTRNSDASSSAQAPQGNRREGKGREGTYIPQQQPLDSPPPPIADDVDSETMDLLGTTNRICRIAGVAIVSPSRLTANLDIVKAWIKDGISVDDTILPTIEAQRKNTKEASIGSLAFYAGRIAKAHADKVGTPEAKAAWTPEARREYLERMAGK